MRKIERNEAHIHPGVERAAVWKSHPVRVLCMVPAECECESPATLLVQWSRGGGVLRHCPTCPADWKLKAHEFLSAVPIFVACPLCKRPMAKVKIGANYGFACLDGCVVERKGAWARQALLPAFLLADLLPHWHDVE